MFGKNFVVRYSEVNDRGETDLQQILHFFQDVGVFHSESLGYGILQDVEHEHVWFLVAWDISIKRMPRLSEELYVTTQPYKMKGFYGYRRYGICDKAGDLIVTGDAIWIFMDPDHLLPKKITPEIAKTYIPEPVDQTVTVKRRLRQDGEWILQQEYEITRQYLDFNHHVNNTYYALWAELLLPQDCVIKRARIEYLLAAALGDKVCVYLCQEKELYRVKFVNQNGETNALIELYTEGYTEEEKCLN